MAWNHRILAHEQDNEVFFQIHEVDYKDGKPILYTKNPATIGGKDVNSIRWTLNKMRKCIKKPILWAGKKFPKEYKKQ